MPTVRNRDTDEMKSYLIDDPFSIGSSDYHWDGIVSGEIFYRLKKTYQTNGTADPILDFEFHTLKNIEIKGKGSMSPDMWQSIATEAFDSVILYELAEYFGDDTPGYALPSFTDIDHKQDILRYRLNIGALKAEHLS